MLLLIRRQIDPHFSILDNIHSKILFSAGLWPFHQRVTRAASNGQTGEIELIQRMSPFLPDEKIQYLLNLIFRICRVRQTALVSHDIVIHTCGYLEKQDICHLALTSQRMLRMIKKSNKCPPDMMNSDSLKVYLDMETY